MRHIRLYEKFEVSCKKCEWSWKPEKSDERPYWCHNCGYDNSDNKYYPEDLLKWRKENGIIDKNKNRQK